MDNSKATPVRESLQWMTQELDKCSSRAESYDNMDDLIRSSGDKLKSNSKVLT